MTVSQEQSEGKEQVNATVTSMNDVTQQNAALAEQTSAAAVSLSNQMGEMIRLIEFFKVSSSSSRKTGTPENKQARSFDRAKSRPTITKEKNNLSSAASITKPVTATETVATVNEFYEDEWEEF